MEELDDTTKSLLNEISGYDGGFKGAYNIRLNCHSIARASSDNIILTPKGEGKSLEIKVLPNTKGEKVYIPACVTHENVDDIVYNDFIIGENSDVTIVAGCGIHTKTGEPARHNGIHRFFLEPNSRVLYLEKHIGKGVAQGQRVIDPVTEVHLSKNSYLEMDTCQLSGVDSTVRKTSGTVDEGAVLIIKENILTEGTQTASTEFKVEMNGDNSSINLISRSVAKDNSKQTYSSNIIGNAKCSGHSECDAILVGNGVVTASPALTAQNPDATLIHEAAIGKIAGEQILKLKTLGLTEEEAENTIIEGFLQV